ncbi:MAG: hypothetical protein EAZ85_11670 [Bacteroidetes bacterium]|nr:MAG: hypothetical protein EAZ85_11670 [Bacteroidota bacterium]TAG89240.1 MAG: hypothetical protein EAZ20_06900 [Bacteroidota bacterium]
MKNNKILIFNQLSTNFFVLSLKLFSILFFYSTFIFAQNDLVTLLNQFKTEQNETQKLNYSLKIARTYAKNTNYEKSIEYYFKSESLAEKINDRKNLAVIYEELGILYQNWNGYEKSIGYFQDALQIETQQNNIAKHIQLKQRIAWANFQLKKYKESAQEYEKVLALQKTLKNTSLAQADTYNQLSVLAEINQNYNQAIEYSQNALELHQNNNQYESAAQDYNNLGVLHQKIGDRKKSIAYFNLAIQTNKTLLSFLPNTEQEATLYNNLGVIRTNMREYSDALLYYTKAQEIRQKNNQKEELAESINYIAANFYLEGEMEKALLKVNKAIEIGKNVNSAEQLKNSYRILSDIYKAEGNLKEYETANKNFTKYDDIIKKKINDKNQEILARKAAIEELEGKLKLATSESEKQELETKKKALELENIKKEKDLAQERSENAQKEAELARSKAEKSQKEAELARANAQTALAESARNKAESDRNKAESENAKAQAIAEKIKREDADQKRQLSEAKAKQALNEQQRLKSERAKENQLYLFSVVAGFLTLVIGFILFFFYKNREKNKLLQKINSELQTKNEEINQQKEEIETQKEALDIEKQKSDELLLNILPLSIAQELKTVGSATPQFYNKVTVLFTDFRGFTNIAAKMTPAEVIKELDYCFLNFDNIIGKYNLEKIKTIGDAYMCAGGIPIANETNPFDAIRAGLEIQKFMQNWINEKKAKGLETWEVRLGIHTGEVIAGVVGNKKFAYDIWGDAVNTASRMESSGDVGMVNISGSTYEYIKDFFDCTYRGKVHAKNKGDVDMYFVNFEKK